MKQDDQTFSINELRVSPYDVILTAHGLFELSQREHELNGNNVSSFCVVEHFHQYSLLLHDMGIL